jgi:hypothetical protein
MRRPTAIATAAALAGGAAVAAAAADDRPPLAGLPFVARVVHVNVVGDRYALRPGDRLFADGSVLLGARGRRVGAATFTCTVTALDPRVDGTCAATLHLPLGRVTGEWPLARSRTPREGRVTGGSGLYRDARGRFLLEPTLRNGDTPFAIDLAS